jgi:hypothetical protein
VAVAQPGIQQTDSVVDLVAAADMLVPEAPVQPGKDLLAVLGPQTQVHSLQVGVAVQEQLGRHQPLRPQLVVQVA